MNAFNLALLFCCFVVSSASAQELMGINVEPAEPTLGQPVEIVVDLKGQGNNGVCGILITFGDGSSQRIRVEENKLPLKLTHTYDRIGNFAISVEGNLLIRGLFGSALPCTGSTRTAAVNVRAEDFAAKEAAEQAAQEAAFKKAAAERQAADRAAQRATADRIAAEKAAQKAASERSAAEKAAAAGASARAAAEKEAAQNAAAQRAAEKASADRTAAEQAASAKPGTEPSRSRSPTVEAPQKSAPVKARSAMDL